MPQWKYFKEADFIFNGEWNDATLIYKGVEFNSNIVLDTIWERFQEYALEIGIDSESEEHFTDYCNYNYYEIKELMDLAIGNEI